MPLHFTQTVDVSHLTSKVVKYKQWLLACCGISFLEKVSKWDPTGLCAVSNALCPGDWTRCPLEVPSKQRYSLITHAAQITYIKLILSVSRSRGIYYLRNVHHKKNRSHIFSEKDILKILLLCMIFSLKFKVPRVQL